MDNSDDNSPPAINREKVRKARGPVSSSCAECKRLKIRCTGPTESFPCTSCIKRGVSAICPQGATVGRTKRDTGDFDILRRHIQTLNARVKELEAEVARLKGQSVSPPASGSDRKTDDEGTSHTKETDDISLVEAFGTLTIEPESGSTTWHGPFTPAINLLPAGDSEGREPPSEHLYDESLPPELAVLAAAFPFTKTATLTGLKDLIRALAPPYDEALQLAEIFFSRASWLGSPYSQERFTVEIIMPLYASKSWELDPANQIALLFSVMAVGAMCDLERPQYNSVALRLHKLCAVSLALAMPLDKPTLATLEALQSHLFFYQLSDMPSAISRFWNIAAIAFRMAQALGLHRDTQKWGLLPADDNRRRLLFWELNFMDAVEAAGYGRPRFFNQRHYDCPFPEGNTESLKGRLTTYRFTFLRDGLIPALEEACAVDPAPTYSTFMKLDRQIRDIPLVDPSTLGLDPTTMTAAECMEFFCVGGLKELVLLYLHRRFMFEAVSDENCVDLTTHKYIYSVNAGFKSAVALARQTRGLFWKDPLMASRLFFIWLHGFSAFSVFAAVVIKRPGNEHASTAMSEMDSLLAVFNQAQLSKRIQRCLPVMVSLREKALGALNLHRAGQSFKVSLDDHLETLLGGAPVPKPPTQSKMEFDLRALFGSGNESIDGINGLFAQTGPSLQFGDSQEPHWDVPLNAPNTVEMSEIDQFLSGYFNDQSSMLNLGTPNWETLI